jgi:hypothetical protein
MAKTEIITMRKDINLSEQLYGWIVKWCVRLSGHRWGLEGSKSSGE